MHLDVVESDQTRLDDLRSLAPCDLSHVGQIIEGHPVDAQLKVITVVRQLQLPRQFTGLQHQGEHPRVSQLPAGPASHLVFVELELKPFGLHVEGGNDCVHLIFVDDVEALLLDVFLAGVEHLVTVDAKLLAAVVVG